VDYADRVAHSQIRAVVGIVADLRAQDDPQLREEQRGVDQRCIFALCTRGIHCTQQHDLFEVELLST